MARLSTWLLLACLALTACTEKGSEPYVRLGDPAPAALASQPGEAYLVALWASWCAPCVAEAPALAALAEKPPRGLTRVAIAVVNEDDAAARRTFPGLPLIPDPEGTLAKELRADALPVAFLVRGDRLVARFDGAREWSAPAARATISRLLATEPPAVDDADGGG